MKHWIYLLLQEPGVNQTSMKCEAFDCQNFHCPLHDVLTRVWRSKCNHELSNPGATFSRPPFVRKRPNDCATCKHVGDVWQFLQTKTVISLFHSQHFVIHSDQRERNNAAVCECNWRSGVEVWMFWITVIRIKQIAKRWFVAGGSSNCEWDEWMRKKKACSSWNTCGKRGEWRERGYSGASLCNTHCNTRRRGAQEGGKNWAAAGSRKERENCLVSSCLVFEMGPGGG